MGYRAVSSLVPNQCRMFRPLRGGILILNANVRTLGTLGLVATSDGTDRWLVTAHHVLAPAAGPPLRDGEPVFQPGEGAGPFVAVTRADRADPDLDAAAARVIDGVEAVGEVLGLGPLAPVKDPVAGMRVVKSGVATGITEGVVEEVAGDRFRIRLAPGFPSKYELSEVSDSGALWLEQGTMAPVGLHRAGEDTGVETATGVPIRRVLEALRLQAVTPRAAAEPAPA